SPLNQCCLVWRKDDNHKLIEWMGNYLGSSDQLHRDWLDHRKAI
ncbi:LysR family transcriptional regulator, partial [Vibrio sp. D173a]|nr:LysR family transcriptional regulator [Vibrio sp. D173a]